LQEKRILRSTTDSLARIADARSEVISRVDPRGVVRNIQTVTKPNSVSKTMRKAAIGLIAAPDPVTTVAGAALLTGSFVTKRNDPTSLADLAAETRKVMRDIRSLTL